MKLKFILADTSQKDLKIGNLTFEIEYSIEELTTIVDAFKEFAPKILSMLQQDSMKWDDLPDLKAAA